MCDFSLTHAKSRAANVGDKLTVKDFGKGTRGFADVADADTAVCILPGTELAFDAPVEHSGVMFAGDVKTVHKVAIFRQINKDVIHTHHDAVEFPDGSSVLLTRLFIGQNATVLQLPAAPKTEAEVESQRRVEAVG